MKRKFTGALLGSAVGDALGAPVEGCSRQKVSSVYGEGGEWKMISGRYTDDTEMMIGVAESLVANRGFNAEDLARRFVANYDPSRGYGPGTKEVLRRLSEGESWEEASKKVFGGAGSYGNGAAMRVAPVGVFYCDDLARLKEVAYKSSQITHSHELGKEGAALQAFCVALAVRGGRGEGRVGERRREREGMLHELKGFVKNAVFREKLEKIELDKAKTRDEVVRELGNGEAAFNSVPTAIYSFLRTDSFKDAVAFAVSLGGDPDTIGAMTGAISGAYYGETAIPKAWLEKLEDGRKGRRYIKRLAEELYRVKISL